MHVDIVNKANFFNRLKFSDNAPWTSKGKGEKTSDAHINRYCVEAASEELILIKRLLNGGSRYIENIEKEKILLTTKNDSRFPERFSKYPLL